MIPSAIAYPSFAKNNRSESTETPGSRGNLPQRLGNSPAIATDVVAQHRATQGDVGTRIETTHKLRPVVVQVGLDSQTPAAQTRLHVLRCAAKTRIQFVEEAIGRVSDLTRKRSVPREAPPPGRSSLRLPVGVQFNGANLRVRPSRPLGIRARRRGDNNQALAAQREADSPLERAVPSQGSADDRVPRRDPEVIRQSRLGLNLVAR